MYQLRDRNPSQYTWHGNPKRFGLYRCEDVCIASLFTEVTTECAAYWPPCERCVSRCWVTNDRDERDHCLDECTLGGCRPYRECRDYYCSLECNAVPVPGFLGGDGFGGPGCDGVGCGAGYGGPGNVGQGMGQYPGGQTVGQTQQGGPYGKDQGAPAGQGKEGGVPGAPYGGMFAGMGQGGLAGPMGSFSGYGSNGKGPGQVAGTKGDTQQNPQGAPMGQGANQGVPQTSVAGTGQGAQGTDVKTDEQSGPPGTGTQGGAQSAGTPASEAQGGPSAGGDQTVDGAGN